MKTTTQSILLLVALGAASLSPIAAQKKPGRGQVRMQGIVDLLPNGDGKARITMRFAAADYTRVKTQNPNAFMFLREFGSRRADYVLDDQNARYDDAKSAIIIEMTERGSVRNLGGGRWELPVEDDFVNIAKSATGTTAYFVSAGSFAAGVEYRGQVHYKLPAGATDVRWNGNTQTLSYGLAQPDVEGAAILGHNVETKKRLMSALYKVYGLGSDFTAMWVAKSVFRNDGKTKIRNLKVRFRLNGYSEWGLWQRYAELVPGQTVVANYYPVLNADIARLTSNTPATLSVEWKFTDASGAERQDSDGSRLVILGGHDFVFSDLIGDESFGTWQESNSNAPFLAAWVSRDDKVVAEFASMANRRAGGVGASSSDENCMKVLGEIYRLWQVNNFTYQHPAGLLDKAVAYDVKNVQSVQFPRDTIRKRSGTCLDLAILYAAMANSVGIDARLAVVPGHCFPVFRLPSGTLVGIESTGVKGGLDHGTVLFDHAWKVGMENLKKWGNDGRIQLLELQHLWTRGISNPEMRELPADICKQWKLRETMKGEHILYGKKAPQGGGGNPQRGGSPQGGGSQAGQNPFLGTWSGTIAEQMDDGSTLRYQGAVRFTAAQNGGYIVTAVAQAAVPNGMGGTVQVRIDASGRGQLRNGTMVIAITRKLLTNVSTGATQAMPGDDGQFVVQNGKLVGKLGNADEGYVQILFSKK